MPRNLLPWLAVAAALAFGVAQTVQLFWTCDDAFISFRYAQNLVDGLGLVFNAGERVEGYTNFAWTLLIAAGMAMGIEGDAVETFAGILGLVFYGGTLALLVVAAHGVARGLGTLPIAAVGLALHHHMASLAPAGLETAMFTFLVTAMLLGTTAAHRPLHWVGVGALGVLAAMTRPDGAIFCVLSGVTVVWDCRRQRSWGLLGGYLLPFLVLYLPYFVWKYWYYGYPVPNTFYAKSGGRPYPGQGLDYAWSYFQCYWMLLPAALALVVACCRRSPDGASGRGHRVALVAAGYAFTYLAFVVWVGGDFMFARFLLPITPALLLGFDLLRPRIRSFWAASALMAVVGAGVLLRVEPDWLDDYGNPHGFSDNRAISVRPFGPSPDLTLAEAFRAVGHYLAELTDGLDIRVAIAGSHANLAYRGGFPVVIECATGLTDAFIAHLQIEDRGRIGHEKSFHHFPGYLQRRGVHVTFQNGWSAGNSADDYRLIKFGLVGTPAKIVVYDAEIMAELAARDPRIRFQRFEDVLDRYIPGMADRGVDQVRRDFEGFRDYYFDHNGDPERQRAFEEFLRQQ